MSRMIFVSLPVRDLPKSKAFYESLGFSINPKFSGDTAACFVFSDTIHVMLLTHEQFKQFAPLPIADATKVSGALLSFSCESRAEVDDVVAKAVAAGGTTFAAPSDLGFMYSHEFQDLDGHGWGWFWMDPTAAK